MNEYLVTLESSRPLMLIAAGVAILTLIVLALLVVVFVHHLVSDRRRRQNRQRFEGAAVMLAPHVVSGDGKLRDAVETARHRFGDRAVGLVLRRSRLDLRGEAAEQVSAVLEDIGAVARLQREAGHRKEWIRVNAVRGLGECGGEKARETLYAAAADSSSAVRRAARDGLLSDGSDDAVRAAIASFLEDLPRRVGWRHAFYARLAAVRPEALLQLVRSERIPKEEQKLGLEALADAGRVEALPACIADMTSPEPELRATAARGLGRLGGPGEIPLLINALSDDEWFVRAAAARALEWILTARAREIPAPQLQTIAATLGSKLTDRSWWVRSNSARALARGGATGSDVLLRTAEGSDAYARDAALAALAMTELTPASRMRLNQIVTRIEQESAQPQRA